MKPATAALTAYLAANDGVVAADLYTIATVGGLTLRLIDYAIAPALLPLEIPAANFPGSPLNYAASGTQAFTRGPKFGRSKVSTKIGIDPAELDISVYAGPSDLIGTLSWQAFANAGGFDGATVELDRFFMPVGSDGIAGPIDTSLGAVVWFYGDSADIDTGRSVIKLKTKSLINRLTQQQMPRRLFQSGCTHIFGDAMCGYDRTTGKNAAGVGTGLGAQTIAALAGSSQFQIATSFSPSPATSYNQGTIIGVSGQNAGLSRAIATLSSGVIALFLAWIYPVAVGDTFTLLPGCDHTSATCNGTFNNLLRYGGFDYIPPPEMAI